MKRGDLVTVDNLPGRYKVVTLTPRSVELEGHDQDGKLFASFDPCGTIYVKRSNIRPVPPQQETLL